MTRTINFVKMDDAGGEHIGGNLDLDMTTSIEWMGSDKIAFQWDINDYF